MRRLLILGAGSAGTTVADKLRRRLGSRDWTITVVDRGQVHLHQPALLALPFGEAGSENLFRPHSRRLKRGITFIHAEIDRVVPHTHHILLAGGRRIEFDYLVIATGTTPRPDGVPGMAGPQWRRTVHEFSSPGGAIALRPALHRLALSGGRLVVPVAQAARGDLETALEFLAKADTYYRLRGARDTVELVCAASPGAVESPVAARRMEEALAKHKVVLEGGFIADRVDQDRSAVLGVDGRELPFDLLVTVPARFGAEYVARSGLGNESRRVPVHPETLRSKAHADIFAVGAAAEPAASEPGNISAAAFADIFVQLASGLPAVGTPDHLTTGLARIGYAAGLLHGEAADWPGRVFARLSRHVRRGHPTHADARSTDSATGRASRSAYDESPATTGLETLREGRRPAHDGSRHPPTASGSRSGET